MRALRSAASVASRPGCGAVAQQRPAPDGHEPWRTAPPGSARRCRARVALLFRKQQRAQAGDAVAGDQAGGDQLPQRILDFTRQPASAAGDVGEERGAARWRGIRTLASRSRRDQRPDRRRRAREARAGPRAARTRAAPSASARPGAVRRAGSVGSSTVGDTRRRRPHATSPARQRCFEVARDRNRRRAPAARRAPMPGRGARRPRADESPRARRRGRGAASRDARAASGSRKRMKSAARDRLDLPAQPSERQAVDARQQRRGRTTPRPPRPALKGPRRTGRRLRAGRAPRPTRSGRKAQSPREVGRRHRAEHARSSRARSPPKPLRRQPEPAEWASGTGLGRE